MVLLSSGAIADFDQRVLAPIFDGGVVKVVGAVIDVRPSKSGRQRIKEELKRGRGGYVLVMAISKMLQRGAGSKARDAEGYFKEHGVPVMRTDQLYAPSTLDWIRACGPDLIYRFGFGIIKEPLLSIAPRGVLSYHHGNLRRYRGQPVAFWEVFHGERDMSVTVQVLNAGLDSGKIVVERAIPIGRSDSWSTVHERAYSSSYDMLDEACSRLESTGFAPVELPATELGRVFTLPNFRQWLVMQMRVAVRKLTFWRNR